MADTKISLSTPKKGYLGAEDLGIKFKMGSS